MSREKSLKNAVRLKKNNLSAMISANKSEHLQPESSKKEKRT